jgi:large subunit ribosomal protein L24
MHLRKGDTVQVTAGDDKGKRGSIITIDRGNGKVVIQGVNRVFKHVKRGHPKSPQGGRLNVEMPIDASNVMLICPETNKPTRVGVTVNDDGSKDLIAKPSGARMRQISPPKNK